MVGIVTNVALTTVGRCSGQACLRWRLFIAFGLMILSLTWCFAQVGMLAWLHPKRHGDIVRQYYSTWRELGHWSTKEPMLYQGVHQGAHSIPGGPPGGPLRSTRGPTRGPTKTHQGPTRGPTKSSDLLFLSWNDPRDYNL